MKQRLIILSDIWGKGKSEWLVNYTAILSSHFDVMYYDCCDLGAIDIADYSEEKLHQQFVNGGIDRAVERLVEFEKGKVSILAFSVGGTIAWQFGAKSKKIKQLVCVSSTRLRHETVKPEGVIKLYYGSEDRYSPPKEWFEAMQLDYFPLEGKGHEIYRESAFAEHLCKQLIDLL